MINIPLDSKRKLWKWGPIDGRPVLPNYWHAGLLKSIKNYPPGWPSYLMYFKNEKIFFVSDYEKLYNSGEKALRKFILDEKKLRSLHKKWQEIVKRLEVFLGDFYAKRIGSLSDESLYLYFQQFNRLYSEEFWSVGIVPELANFGGEAILSEELKKKLKNDKDFHLAMERLSAPEDYSFYQAEELDLLALKFVKNKEEFEKRLIKHQQKYFWPLNNYHHVRILPVNYFRKILEKYSLDEAETKITEIREFKKKAIKQKEQVIKKYRLPKNLLKISTRLAFCIWWQDHRKSYIFQANNVIDLFLREVAKRAEMPAENLYFYVNEEVEGVIRNKKKISNEEIRKRKDNFLIIFDYSNLSRRFISGPKAEQIIRPFFEKKVDKDISEFRGMVVNHGKVQGRAKIILSPKEANKVKKGDVLVASMTSPDYILALKRASAVITDVGGMTCHAAIVSRELKIPGIVGTKIATQVLRDGQLVEVDANHGIVRILK